MADELTDDQRAELRAALGEIADRLRGMLEMSKDGARPVDLDEPIGRLSRMDAIQQQEMLSTNRAASERRLRLVTAALAACDRGEYGWCRSCEEPIAYRRLSAAPETPFCLSCQSAKERRS